MRVRRNAVMWMVAGGVLALGGCALQKKAPTARVLKTEEFVSDPTTMPQEPVLASEIALPAAASAPVVTAATASEGVFDVSARIGKPEDSGEAPKAAGPVQIVDAKVGEINGRPVRVDDVLGELGPRLAASARSKRFSREEWSLLLFPAEPDPNQENKAVRRDEWMDFATKLVALRLNADLENQLLAEEARASLKPEQKQGLKYLVEQATEEERRKAGGSEAEFQRQLREKNLSQRDFEKTRESVMLIGYQLSEKLRKRIRTSWKDVRLYYERNSKVYNPPPVAKFRLIQVPADQAAEIADVQTRLDAGEPFATVARLPINTYGAKDGGKYPDQKFEGEFAAAKFFPGDLNAQAVKLQPGEFTRPPIDFSGKKTWVFLEAIDRRSQPLSDPDVQLTIAMRLDNAAFDAEKRAYIGRLKSRATFSDIEMMSARLAEIAGQRYWPKEP